MISFNDLKKNLKKQLDGARKVKIAILADSASQFVNQAIKGYGREVQLDFEVYEADYNQIDLQVFDPFSGLYAFEPDFIFINRSTERLLIDFYKRSRQQKASLSADIQHVTRQYYEAIASRLGARVIVNTFPEINDGVFGNYASKVDSSFLYQLRRTNLALMDLSREIRDLFICDIAALQSQMGYENIFDARMYFTADMVYSIDFLPHLAKSVIDIVLSIQGSFKKCLVLDLDNTLWGGIIGDDGMEGIEVGYYGMGKVFTELQLWALNLKQRGIILAVCSKNTEEIALEPFKSHPDMVLRPEDIAIFVANWETKVDNLRYIQSVLNVGFDAMVFLDDNAFEREMVRSAIPEVTVPELPEDPAEFMTYLRSLNLFETANFTEDDEERTNQYRVEAMRTRLQRSYTSENDFLASLVMRAEAKPFDTFTIPRVAQLTQRSNQFNLRTVRYTEEDIKRISDNKDHYTLSLSLEDRFGNHGLIGVIILKKQDAETLFIDTWIMSCRVLKRGMENFTMNTVAAMARANGFKRVIGEYIPTKKNGIVKDHYAELGFVQADNIWIANIENYRKRDTFIGDKNELWSLPK